MNNATLKGGRYGQFFTLIGFSVYCFKASNVPMKFVLGFLYCYWINHFYTIGSYCGALVKMPKAYRRVGDSYSHHGKEHPNLMDRFEDIMKQETDY
jgi:hypothetical protein